MNDPCSWCTPHNSNLDHSSEQLVFETHKESINLSRNFFYSSTTVTQWVILTEIRFPLSIGDLQNIGQYSLGIALI